MKTQSTKNPVPEGIYLYYVRGTQNEIIGSVAFRPNNDGTVNRGIAVTGIGESGSRRIGRAIAINRLNIAEEAKESSRPLKFGRPACNRFAVFFEGGKAEMDKCAYRVAPTPKEAHILDAVS